MISFRNPAWPDTENKEGYLKNCQEQLSKDPFLQEILHQNGLIFEENPDNKILENIYIFSNDVFNEYDPFPVFLNFFHARSKVSVIEQELIFKTGEQFDWLKIIQTIQNLNSHGIFSKIDILPVKAKDPEKGVSLAIVTKDLFSLRIENNFSINGTSLEDVRFFKLYLTERNFLGYNKSISGFFELFQDDYTFGEYYSDPRIFNSKYSFFNSSKLYLKRQTFPFEKNSTFDGYSIQTSLTKPSLSLTQKWDYGISTNFSENYIRIFKGSELDYLVYDEKKLPRVYKSNNVSMDLNFSRSFYMENLHKSSLTLGTAFDNSRYSLLNDLEKSLTENPDRLAEYKKDLLPFSENQKYIYINWSSLNPEWVSTRNLATYQRVEYVQKGYYFVSGIDLSRKLFTSDRNFIRLYLSYQYRLILEENIFNFMIHGSTRLETEEFFNNKGIYTVAYRTPPFFIGNFFTRFYFSQLHNPMAENSALYIGGGDNYLRGFLADVYEGKKKFAHSLEFRTEPFELYSLLVGFVVFHDIGDAADKFDQFYYNGSAGTGIRLLVPQFNREIMRIDLAYPYRGKGKFEKSYFSLQYNHFFGI